MSYLVIVFATIFIITPIGIYYVLRNADKKTNIENKRSDILFNAILLERNVALEAVFKTLDGAGIEPDFLQN